MSNLVACFTTIKIKAYKLGSLVPNLMMDLEAHFFLALECSLLLDPKE